MASRITRARIEKIIEKLERAQGDIDKMRIGDTMARDAQRVKSLGLAWRSIFEAIDHLDNARPLS